jgi:hypothetical protein
MYFLIVLTICSCIAYFIGSEKGYTKAVIDCSHAYEKYIENNFDRVLMHQKHQLNVTWLVFEQLTDRNTTEQNRAKLDLTSYKYAAQFRWDTGDYHKQVRANLDTIRTLIARNIWLDSIARKKE